MAIVLLCGRPGTTEASVPWWSLRFQVIFAILGPFLRRKKKKKAYYTWAYSCTLNAVREAWGCHAVEMLAHALKGKYTIDLTPRWRRDNLLRVSESF